MTPGEASVERRTAASVQWGWGSGGSGPNYKYLWPSGERQNVVLVKITQWELRLYSRGSFHEKSHRASLVAQW